MIGLDVFPTSLWPNRGFPQVTAVGQFHVPVEVREGGSDATYDVKEVKVRLSPEGFEQETVGNCHVVLHRDAVQVSRRPI